MFDSEKKQTAIEALAAMCHQCGDKHSDECPLAKAIASAKLIPTQE
ncbi:hypothetical protein Desor_2507 [Desulfosporosinus orientis DSM 765]|uniref:Uncharacterized protein n=1 Tax=Desulfosporosinus orientis (strain ATCC 19365 / DSM 765 / NCIMB 8382 / VKM B-1628 / Singapore I) TaxID=768706 RepID=G7WGI9_DESOD|nr:hypothetical protein [Desulfosporosinus orientis]AET68066.1 hypothetical protein Desor_2507 [Desulfosporosinus orientis DSM 765]